MVLRLARLYGPGRASAELVNMLRSGGGVIVGDGSNYVSSLHVFDAATAHLAALEIDAGLYNVADDQPTTSLELVSAQTRAVGGPPPQRMPASVAHGQLGEASYMLTISPRVSNRRFKTASGWAPKHPNAIEGSESLL